MEVHTATDEPTETPETAWNEARIESSLARLQELHARVCLSYIHRLEQLLMTTLQLSSLRDTVSRLVDPMIIQKSSPEELYMSFASNATTIKSDIQDFTRLVHDDGSKELFRKAAESRLQNSEDIRGWRVTEHEEWLDVRNVDSPVALGTNGTVAPDEDVPRDFTIEELRATMERFKTAHSSIDGSLDEVSKALMVTLPSPAGIHFKIAIQKDPSTQSRYTVTCAETSNMCSAIVRHVNTIGTKLSLGNLLDLLASYSNFKNEPCTRCGRLLDRNAQFPLLRIEKKSRKPDGHIEMQWQPCHPGCL
ncbi:MAG: hypothetical protein Q9223_002953 [Gallowayella weberi]